MRRNALLKKSLASSLLIIIVYSNSYADCPTFTGGTLDTVTRVVDGDTLHLATGVKVRLAGINTMELGYDERPDDAKAMGAKHLLERIISANGHQVRLEPATEPTDNYGRLVAHAYTNNGNNIQEQILHAGLALGYAYPPNLEYLECYRAAETSAREQHLGLWSIPAIDANHITNDIKGFVRIQGVVHKINTTRKSIWIELGKLSLHLASKDMQLFNNFNLNTLLGTKVEARGYLNTYKSKLQMRIRHPADLLLNIN